MPPVIDNWVIVGVDTASDDIDVELFGAFNDRALLDIELERLRRTNAAYEFFPRRFTAL